MSDDNSNPVQIDGTRFYKRSIFSGAFRIVVITIVVFALLSFLALWFVIDSGARQAYKEARDVRKALRAVGTEYYGDTTSIYDPDSSNGLADGAAEKIAYLSQRKGTVTLYEWDGIGNGPLRFEYQNGLYRVVYTDTGYINGTSSGIEGDFKVYYSFELLKYEAL
ncbi:MAG: hypothetical protein K6E72_05350 [Saccharofermentans sp.]|nr:hypothetical protein [Saccharofermentans sp.]